MKKILFASLFWNLGFVVLGQACQYLGPDQTLPCGQTSTTLTANFANCTGGTSQPPKETSSYAVANIPFAPEPVGGTQIFLGDDQVSPVQPIGFTFCFFGNTYTNFYIGSNGWISFTPGQPTTFTSAPLPSAAFNVPKNCIMGPWQDWHPGIGGQIRYQTQGVAPCRKLVVSFTSIPFFSCTGTTGTYQIVLHEGTNLIDSHITNKQFCSWGGGTATQGIHNQPGTVAFTVPGRNSSVWTTTNNSWRYTPNGPDVAPILTWYQIGNPTPIATGVNSITVTPPAGGAYYTAVQQYSGCYINYGACVGATGGIPQDTVFVLPNANIPPLFAGDLQYCQGANIQPLSNTSTNNIVGTWAPVINNQQTTTYTFTPNAGQCSNPVNLTITIVPNSLPNFNQMGPFCVGDVIPNLPMTSTNMVSGSWSPVVNNQQTTTYNFNPFPAQCALATSMTIAVNPSVNPIFNQVGPFCSGSNIPPLPTTSTNNVTGVWSPAINNLATTTYTFTPNPGQCSGTATMTISITDNDIPTFSQSGPFCAGAVVPDLPTTSTNGVTGTWSPAINNQITTTYTFTPTVGLCALTANQTIAINPNILPTFNNVGAFCAGSNIPPLATTSTNNFTGIWSPVINNQQTTTYTFTPSLGLCATTATTTINITPNITPTFNQEGPFCTGTTINPLPNTSLNNIAGTWSPAINNTQTTTYTFTANAGVCANVVTMTITINQLTPPQFSQAGPFCAGAAIPNLLNTSLNNIVGSWSPAINNQNTTNYTFVPNVGQCAANASMTIVINPNITPTFNQVGPYCDGASIPALPTNSNNNYAGSWFPAVSNSQTATYTFSPNAGLCATQTTMTVTIIPNEMPIFDAIAPYCFGVNIPDLPTSSINNFAGTWSPAINNQQTSSYTFTPNPGLCAFTTTANIEILPNAFSTTNMSLCAAQMPYVWNGVTVTTAGQYTAILLANNGCDSIATLNMTVLPALSGTTDITICQNQVPYLWNGSTYTLSGVYTRNLTASNGCDSTGILNLTVVPIPHAAFTASLTQGCAPLSVSFTNTSNSIGTTVWDLGNGSILNTSSGVVGVYNADGCYDVSLTVTTYPGCSTTYSLNDLVCVEPAPIASFALTPQILTTLNSTGSFTNTSIGSSNQTWYFGHDSATSGAPNPVYTYPAEMAYYTVSLVVSNANGCTDSVAQTILVDNQVIYYIPNSFSPNGDDFNQSFKPIFSTGFDPYAFNFQVYNRWGEILFESKNASFGWDGTFGGEICPSGTYIWQIRYKEIGKDRHDEIRGHFNLLR